MLRRFFNLPHALEIADGGGDVFDAYAQKRGNGDAEQLGELVERLDLGEFAFFKPVERRARNAKLFGDLVRAQARAHAIGPEPVSDFIKTKSHVDLPRRTAQGLRQITIQAAGTS